MNQKKIGNKLYVFSETAYEITQDTDASIILIQQECIDAYKALNSSAVNAKMKPINYKLFCVQTQEWMDYYNDLTVTVGTITGGTVTASPTSADEGEEITLTQSASTGYEFTSWDVEDADSNEIEVTNNKFTMPASNVTVNAVFDKIDFDITIDSTIQNGTLSAPSTANLGDTVTITATPSTGYKLDTLTVMCGSLEVTVVNNQFTMPAGDVSITGTFIQDGIPYEQQYFTIESKADNNTITVKQDKNTPFYVSVDNGATWELAETTDAGTTNKKISKTLANGDKMLVKASSGNFVGPMNDESMSEPAIQASQYFIVYGNIMSLIYGDNFANKTTISNDGAFNCLFTNSDKIKDASNLILPATTLAQSCYSYMFNNCAYLEGAPVLPATTLTQMCYDSMFYQCNSLNSITCLATDISATNCTRYWLADVAESGTFTKAATMSSWTTGENGIPSGWTVQDAA